MRCTPRGIDYPEPGATMTAAKLHAMVDNASLTQFELAELSGLGSGAAVGSLAGDYYMRQVNEEVYHQPVSAISLSGYGLRSLLGKCDLAWYECEYGYVAQKGMPAFMPGSAINTRGNWSGWTAYKHSASMYFPRVSQDQQSWFGFPAFYVSTSYPDAAQVEQVYGIVDEALTKDGLIKWCTYGYCDALVHATLSNGLSLPGTIYQLSYDFTDGTLLPCAVQYTDPSAFTLSGMPMGLVRRVYTESGVTQLPFVYESESSASLVPYYVARIFFGGWPCL